ncbi:hypothetical protein QTH90_29135 [Variovorax sp. J2P1-59]|uniref:hypothetical protein n=1 Tax=Variovorax flavidus TaxID=3053501 RepID=UPI0025764DA1|nr:hypothetical protein [Variovorax sp. J2P1-59]MDM0078504.1 hypothetical protein [Variovorax sp. J2P1-59]
MVEHVTDHEHAAAHPLSAAAERRMAELGHAALAERDGLPHHLGSLELKTMATSDVSQSLLQATGQPAEAP